MFLRHILDTIQTIIQTDLQQYSVKKVARFQALFRYYTNETFFEQILDTCLA